MILRFVTWAVLSASAIYVVAADQLVFGFHGWIWMVLMNLYLISPLLILGVTSVWVGDIWPTSAILAVGSLAVSSWANYAVWRCIRAAAGPACPCGAWKEWPLHLLPCAVVVAVLALVVGRIYLELVSPRT
jgi:hypothetical protein